MLAVDMQANMSGILVITVNKRLLAVGNDLIIAVSESEIIKDQLFQDIGKGLLDIIRMFEKPMGSGIGRLNALSGNIAGLRVQDRTVNRDCACKFDELAGKIVVIAKGDVVFVFVTKIHEIRIEKVQYRRVVEFEVAGRAIRISWGGHGMRDKALRADARYGM